MYSPEKLPITETVLKEITDWLSQIDGNLKLPANVNGEFMECIIQIMELDEKGKEDFSEVSKLQRKYIDEYKKSTEEIDSLLSSAGLSLDDFPPDFQEKVGAIAKLAVDLNLENPISTSVMLGLFHLENTKKKNSELEKIHMHTLFRLIKRMNFIAKENQHYQKHLAEEEKLVNALESQQSKTKRSTEFLENKNAEYIAKEIKLKKFHEESGFDPMLCHKELVKRSEELKMLKEKLNTLTLALGSYQNLPPDEDLTKLKLEEARAELYRLEKEFEFKTTLGFVK